MFYFLARFREIGFCATLPFPEGGSPCFQNVPPYKLHTKHLHDTVGTLLQGVPT